MSISIFLLALSIGLCIGMVMGLTGAGGGILAVPALVYSQDWSMQQAMPVALFAVCLGALIGAVDGLRKKQVRYKASILMAMMGAPFASLGILTAKNMEQRWLIISFALILLIVATRLIYQLWKHWNTNSSLIENENAIARVNRQTGKFDWNPKTFSVISLIGVCAGFFSGLLGVGGGFLIFPLLKSFTNLSIQSVTATSLMVIALVSSFAISSAILHGAQLPILFSMVFASATVMGVLFGRQLSNYVPLKIIQVAFISLLICIAVSFLLKAA